MTAAHPAASGEDLGQPGEVSVVFEDLLAGGQALFGFVEAPQSDERSGIVVPTEGATRVHPSAVNRMNNAELS